MLFDLCFTNQISYNFHMKVIKSISKFIQKVITFLSTFLSNKVIIFISTFCFYHFNSLCIHLMLYHIKVIKFISIFIQKVITFLSTFLSIKVIIFISTFCIYVWYYFVCYKDQYSYKKKLSLSYLLFNHKSINSKSNPFLIYFFI